MGKFAISCPKCKNYVTAFNGIRGFFHKKITCSCGNKIDVYSERMTAVSCPHCKNVVIYDQGKKKPVCPVCNKEIAPASGQKIISFKCPECGVALSSTEGAPEYSCPICDNHIDVQREVAKEKYAKEGLASIIKYEGDNNTFVWKHPIEDFNTGSQLIVHENQEAIFFRDGQALDLFGSGRYTLETASLPAMDKVYKLPTGDTRATFHSEVYFINLTTLMGIKWGTDTKVRLFDPASGMHISVGASGEFNIRVIDSRRILLKLVGTTNGLIMQDRKEWLKDVAEGKADKREYSSSIPTMYGYFRSLIMTKVKSYLANVIKQESINILEIDSQLEKLSGALRDRINEGLEEYGLTMPEFYVVRIVTPEDDKNDPAHEDYIKMKSLFAQRYLGIQEEQMKKATAEAAAERKTVEAQTEARMKIIGAQGEAEALKIQKAAEAEVYRLQAQAEAAEMQMKGYTYQQETAREVGLESMKNGLTGNGSAGSLGDVAGLGVTLGAMGGVIGMTKEAIQPLTTASQQISQTIGQSISSTWSCTCGQTDITSKYCPDCGQPRPQPIIAWDCSCGKMGIMSKFCPECGKTRPKAPTAWDCTCGKRGITSKFCPECGNSRPADPDVWDCECGKTAITSRFCPECGRKRGGNDG